MESFQNCKAVQHYIMTAYCHLCILVVIATAYNNETTFRPFSGKCQAYKSKRIPLSRKKGFDSLVQAEKVFGQDHNRKSSNLEQSGFQFSVTGWCLKSAWRLMAWTRKSGHMLRCTTPLPELPEPGVPNSRNVCAVPGKFSSTGIFHTSACCESKHLSFGKLCSQDRFTRSVSCTDTKSRSNK